MIRKFRNLLIRILFRLIDGEFTSPEMGEREAKLIKAWMIDSATHEGYRLFLEYRHKKIASRILEGSAMAEIPRDDYIRIIGQRFELIRIKHVIDKTYMQKLLKEKLEKKNKELKK